MTLTEVAVLALLIFNVLAFVIDAILMLAVTNDRVCDWLVSILETIRK